MVDWDALTSWLCGMPVWINDDDKVVRGWDDADASMEMMSDDE